LNDWPPPRAATVPRMRIGKRWINVKDAVLTRRIRTDTATVLHLDNV